MSDAHLDEESCIALAWGEAPAAAVAHAEACPDCAARVAAMRVTVAQAESLLQPLAPPAPLDDAATERQLARLRAAIPGGDAPWRRWAPAALAALVTALLVARGVAVGHDVWLPVGAWLAALAALALAATEHAARVAAGTLVLSLALALAHESPGGPLLWQTGLPCLRLELAVGLVAGAASAWLRRDARAVEVAATCGAGALAAQAGVSLTCHGTGGLAHTLLFHGLGVALALALGWPLTGLRARFAAPTAR